MKRLQTFLQVKLNSLSVQQLFLGSELRTEWLAEVRLWDWRVS